MFFNIFKAWKVIPAPVLQHIAFPVSEFDALTSDQKRENHNLMDFDGWQFTARSDRWIVMSRESAIPAPSHFDGLYGIAGCRLFLDAELCNLHYEIQVKLNVARVMHQKITTGLGRNLLVS